MNKRVFSLIISAFFCLTLSANSYAEKPAWAGSGKPPTAEQKQQHKEAMNNKNGDKAYKEKRVDQDNDDENKTVIEKTIEDIKKNQEENRPWWKIF